MNFCLLIAVIVVGLAFLGFVMLGIYLIVDEFKNPMRSTPPLRGDVYIIKTKC